VVFRTRLTDLVGCEVPVQQAGMGWVAGVDLAVAVAEAGGLGTVAFPLAPPTVLNGLLDQVFARTNGAVGLNLIVPFVDDETVFDIAAKRMRVVEFFWADPDPALVERTHRGGALAAWQVGSVAEARAAQNAGCDFVMVQGREAGGHLRGDRALLPLLAEVLDAVTVPVVAAGGIATGRSMAAALAAGASGVRVGTRFVATTEADAHPIYKQALVDAEQTVVTEEFATMWPDAPHRVVASCVDLAHNLEGEFVGDITFGGIEMQVPVRSMVSPLTTMVGEVEAMALYAGEGVGSITDIKTAADVVRELVAGAEEYLQYATGLAVRAERTPA
jgi:nitronate monooxygenase